jgi:hypothetical protein
VQSDGISLNTDQGGKQRRAVFAAVGVAVAAFAVAAAALGFACGQSVRGDAPEAGAMSPAEAAETQSGAAPSDAPETGNSNGSDEPTDDPTTAAEEPAPDEPTATPTDEPTATPTATPDDGDPCPLCPDDVDDIVAPEPEGDPCPLCPDGLDDLVIIPPPTPADPCAFCDDPLILAEPAPLEFEHYGAENCEALTAMSAGLNRVAWIWVEYTLADGSEDHQTPKHWNDSLYVEQIGKYVWFGSWGWIYAYDITFHAMDEDGEEIVAHVNAEYC